LVVWYVAEVVLRIVFCLVVFMLLTARAGAQPSLERGPEKPPRTTFLQASLGYLLPVPGANRDDHGVDLGAAYGWRHGSWRLGGEARYTFAGGFDADQPTYRFDIGVLPAVQVLSSRYVALQLSLRGLFSRAGTYRRSDVPVQRASPGGPVTDTVSFVAWYGFTASFDITLLFPYCFVRASGMHTSWYWSHERDPPHMEHWAHFAVGYAF
jgi:hypothetical protein